MLPWQQYFRYQYFLYSFTSAVFLQYSDEVWSKLESKMVNSKHFENDTLPAAIWWRYNFAS